VHAQFYEACLTIFLASSLAAYSLLAGRPGRSRQLFVSLLGSIIVWSSGVAISRAVVDPGAAALGVQLSFVGIFALPPAWYALSLHLTGSSDRVVTLRRCLLLAVPSLIALAAVATNPWHHLYMRDPMAVIDHGPLEWGGPAFWVWVAWAYLLVIGGSIRYIGWSWRLVHGDAQLRGALIGIASVLPLSGNVAHLLGWTAGDHDLTPLLLGGATLMLFLADWRFRMLDTLPVARRDVIDQLRDGVIVADPNGMILDLNPAALAMIDATTAELVGKPLVAVAAAKSVDRFDLDAARFQKTVTRMCQSAGGFETTITDMLGRHYEIRGAGVADRVGAVSGLYLIMRDITERKRLEEVQRESRRAQSIASLAAGIAHEVNNPLSYARANVGHVIEVLENGRPTTRNDPDATEARDERGEKDETEDTLAALADALEGIDRIGTIVERVREFTRTGGSVREPIELGAVVDEALRLCRPDPVSMIQLVADIEPALRPVTGVRDGLIESVVNLLDNAQHALRDSGGTIHVRVRALERTVRLEVEDDGPGIPEELREQIFEPFFAQGEHGFGVGLGLAITRKLVADFGGTLGHEPVPTGGARFVIELPS